MTRVQIFDSLNTKLNIGTISITIFVDKAIKMALTHDYFSVIPWSSKLDVCFSLTFPGFPNKSF